MPDYSGKTSAHIWAAGQADGWTVVDALDSHAAARAPCEGNITLLHLDQLLRRCAEPAVRVEFFGFGEDLGVLVHELRGHAHRRAPRNNPAAVREIVVRENTGQAVDRSVAEPG